MNKLLFSLMTKLFGLKDFNTMKEKLYVEEEEIGKLKLTILT
jgi:hypothetical protein